jgi:hypothetical protein
MLKNAKLIIIGLLTKSLGLVLSGIRNLKSVIGKKILYSQSVIIINANTNNFIYLSYS